MISHIIFKFLKTVLFSNIEFLGQIGGAACPVLPRSELRSVRLQSRERAAYISSFYLKTGQK